MVSRYRVLPYVFACLLIIVFIARSFELFSRSGRVFIESGILSDRLCYLGSFEMIICPAYLPPYETFLAVLAIMLVVSMWANWRK